MTTEVITAPDIQATIKRIVAKSLIAQGDRKVAYFPNADQELRNRDILAIILWDLVTFGKAKLADGTELIPDSYSDWLATAKYLITHIDGPTGQDEGYGQNVFKVYVGVNIDKV